MLKDANSSKNMSNVFGRFYRVFSSAADFPAVMMPHQSESVTQKP